MRASDADRERAIDVLKAGFAEGRLTREEFGERQEGALRARTYRDLAALIADLPVGPVGAVSPFGAGGGPFPADGLPANRRTNPLAIASLFSAFIPFFGSVAAIVLGHAARREIRVTRERGSGLAAAGIALGYLTIAMFVLVTLLGLAVTAHAPGGFAGPPG